MGRGLAGLGWLRLKTTCCTALCAKWCFVFLCSDLGFGAETPRVRKEPVQVPPVTATDPQLPASHLQKIPDGELPQSARDWHYAHTRQTVKFSFVMGDQGGGPVRYNTRFPEVKGNPHPASYYHAAPFAGAELEFSLARGGILLGGLVRRDLWHKGIEGRSLQYNQETWVVTQFRYVDNALVVGWVFGERYWEAPWTADLSAIYDTGTIKINMMRSTGGTESEGRARLIALSMRGRLQFWWMPLKRVSLGAGPELHAPLYQATQIDSDAEIEPIISSNLSFKSAAAIGATMSASYSF